MNDELKIKDLKADKRRIEDGISEFITKNLQYFAHKYGVDVDVDIRLSKAKTCYGEIVSMQTQTKLLVEL